MNNESAVNPNRQTELTGKASRFNRGKLNVNDEQWFWLRVALTTDDTQCWEWLASRTGNGYGSVYFHKKTMPAHRVAWFLTYGHYPSSLLLHSCDNPICVNPRHLREGTHLENMRDRTLRNRQARGEQIGVAVLERAQVIQIKTLLKGGVKAAEIARRFNVSNDAISHIKHGRNWAWLST